MTKVEIVYKSKLEFVKKMLNYMNENDIDNVNDLRVYLLRHQLFYRHGLANIDD